MYVIFSDWQLPTYKFEKGLTEFAVNVKRYPASPNIYDSLGEAYELNSQFKMAEKNYQKAYDLGKQQNDANLSVYKLNLERVQQK